MDRFLIFALERSGSTSLAAALNRDFSMVQEPFSSLTGDLQTNDLFIRLVDSLGCQPENLPEEKDDPYAYNRFHRLARNPAQCAAYLEALYGQFTGIKHVRNTVSRAANLIILDWCLANGVKIVFLSRVQMARALLSRFLAQQAQVHNLGQDMEFREQWEQTEFAPIDVELFRQQLQEFQEDELAYREHLVGKPCLYLAYEQLYLGWTWRRRRRFAALCRFISARPDDFDAATLKNYLFNPARKQTDHRAIERIPNYRALKPFL